VAREAARSVFCCGTGRTCAISLRLAADAVVIAVEVMRIRIGHVPTDAKAAVRDV
jgi:hypothetical protein